MECRFVSKFEEAGINQTKHSLYLELVSDISIILPSRSTNLASTIEVLICESSKKSMAFSVTFTPKDEQIDDKIDG